MEQEAVAVLLVELPDESTTWAVKEKVPACVGVPVIAPVLEFNVSPVGKLPVTIEYV